MENMVATASEKTLAEMENVDQDKEGGEADLKFIGSPGCLAQEDNPGGTNSH